SLCVSLRSSRRRHTRSTRDWSSDVCSSDLFYVEATLLGASDEELAKERRRDRLYETLQGISSPDFFVMIEDGFQEGPESPPGRRSEERRVGNECRAGDVAGWGSSGWRCVDR